MAEPRRLFACVLGSLVAVGCGAGDREIISGTGLPTVQLHLAGDLCEDSQGVRARARRQVARLESAYRTDPEARVHTTFEPAHEPGGRREDMSIRELVQVHVLGAQEVVETGDRGAARCAQALAQRLSRLLDRGD